MPEPVNKKLYDRVKDDAKKKFERYPSIYASSWIVREYKKRGGSYKGAADTKSGLNLWYREQWVQVQPYLSRGAKIQCGSDNKDGKACRPLRRRSSKTPITIGELLKIHSAEKLLRLAAKKEKDMNGRVNWKAGRFTQSR